MVARGRDAQVAGVFRPEFADEAGDLELGIEEVDGHRQKAAAGLRDGALGVGLGRQSTAQRRKEVRVLAYSVAFRDDAGLMTAALVPEALVVLAGLAAVEDGGLDDTVHGLDRFSEFGVCAEAARREVLGH
jgi:hypothetical protein